GMTLGAFRDALVDKDAGVFPVEEWENTMQNTGTRVGNAIGRFFAEFLFGSIGNTDQEDNDLVTINPTSESISLLDTNNASDPSTAVKKSAFRNFGFRPRLWKSYVYWQVPLSHKIRNESRVEFSLNPFDFGDITISDGLVIPSGYSSHFVFGGEYRINPLESGNERLTLIGRWEKHFKQLKEFPVFDEAFLTIGVRYREHTSFAISFSGLW
ncbi:MAG: hypothetical protein M3Q80_01845, partial [bacterium]|nr:hypothetical protein [bacterium]